MDRITTWKDLRHPLLCLSFKLGDLRESEKLISKLWKPKKTIATLIAFWYDEGKGNGREKKAPDNAQQRWQQGVKPIEKYEFRQN